MSTAPLQAQAQQVAGGEGCVMRLRDGSVMQLDPAQCQQLAAQDDAMRGEDRWSRADRRAALRAQRLAEWRARQAAEDAADVGKVEGWVFEAGLGFGAGVGDTKYEERLNAFGYRHLGSALGHNLRLSISAGRRLLPNLLVGLSYGSLEADNYARSRNANQNFEWTGHALFAFVQADVAFGRRRLMNLFGRLGVGASYAWTTFDAIKTQTGFPSQSVALENTSNSTEEIVQHYVRPAGYVSGGMQWMPARYAGLSFELRYVIAPALRNELGDYQDLGGINFVASLRARTWE